MMDIHPWGDVRAVGVTVLKKVEDNISRWLDGGDDLILGHLDAP